MKKQWTILLSGFLILIIVVFSVLNSQSVPIKLGVATFSAPLVLVIVGSALIGVLVGVIPSVGNSRQLQKRIQQLEHEKRKQAVKKQPAKRSDRTKKK